jgi:uracil-DNA glycosylase family 4
MGTDFSQVEGTGALGVMIVAEASGEMEARDQLPLRPYAPAGSLLERTFRRMGHSRQQFSLTNTLRCRPRNNWLVGAPWEFSALNHCRPNLDAAIADRRPRAILALGDTALRELTGEAGETRGVSHLGGYVLRGPSDIPVIPTWHPAFIRRGKAAYQGIFARNLQRAVNVAAGKDREWEWDLEEAQRNGRIRYQVHPSLDEARSYERRVGDNAGLIVSYDIETFESASLDEDARDGFTDTRIRLIQFSVQGGEGIALPWEGDYREIAARLLRSPNVKCGHNLWLFDNRVLEACGAREGLDLRPRGPIHDTLAMFHHWQPDLPAHLQFAAQFVQFPFPWKHLAATDLEFYGCVDVDATLRLYEFLSAQLKRDGLWDSPYDAQGDCVGGYVGQVAQVRPILAAMERRGLPVDDAERLKLDGEFDAAQQELDAELQRRVPPEVLGLEPRRGKKGNYDYGYLREPKDCTSLVQRRFNTPAVDEATGEPVTRTVERWCRIVPFNPNSPDQLKRYMDARGHKRPKSREQDDEGNDKDTTAKKELVRLAHRTGDDFYLRVIEYRELSKMRGTYIEGFKPHADGRAHPTFTFDTGTGQLSSRNPNAQNIPEHVRLAKAIKRMFAAPDDHIITKWDYKAFHVLTTGFEAQSPNWMRMARLDMHSFVAWHFLKLPHADELISLEDGDFLERVKWFRSDEKRDFVRNKQAKPADLGIGFGMGPRRLFQENMEYFDGEKQARKFHDLLHDLFSEVICTCETGQTCQAWQHRIRLEAHDKQILKSRWGHARRFYEVFVWNYKKAGYDKGDQAEEAVAFVPANDAHGFMRQKKKDFARLGLDYKYGLINEVHDSWWWCLPRWLLDEHIAEMRPLIEAPLMTLNHPTLAPDGLWCAAECKVGPNLAEMKEAAYAMATVSQ